MIVGETKLYHPIAGVGTLVKEFIRPIYGAAIIIKLTDGREYFAPYSEFKKLN